ncbi:hypothetical protein ACFY2V_22770 [Streptomyces eurythermus]|uniref:hypothetical protein n=1 Tax=Streptomyces eurythermus TaxID=42237 RepID=UPI00369FF7ED
MTVEPTCSAATGTGTEPVRRDTGGATPVRVWLALGLIGGVVSLVGAALVNSRRSRRPRPTG